jgi:energy-coupling factor transporter ATP-binding protein EcfA2
VVEDMLASRAAPEVEFGLAQLPEAAPGDLSVRLVSIEKAEHVNALASETPLTFEPSGLTIVYGDNASGKSGYARLLKRIARSRHQEEVLSDVFRDTNLATPTATLKVRVGEDDRTFAWPEASAPELKRMLYYDGACCGAYISDESDFPYRPSALFVMDGLIEACVAVRSRIDARLEANGKATTALPVIDDEVKDTEAGQLLARISGSTSVDAVDALVAKLDPAAETVEHLKEQEARLRAADTTKERQKLTREAEKFDAICAHLESVHATLAADALAAPREQRDRVTTLQEAAEVLARAFESEPLPWRGKLSMEGALGVGEALLRDARLPRQGVSRARPRQQVRALPADP